MLDLDLLVLHEQARLEEDISSLAARGLSAALIATTLSLPLSTVQSVLAHPSPRSEKSELSSTEILARTIYAETRGESFDGKEAVASVIFNRAYGDTSRLVQVVLKPKQFSCWNSGSAIRGREGEQAWEDSKKLAHQLLSGGFEPSIYATHYFNPKKCRPSWAYYDKAMTKPRTYVDIGNHRFLTERIA